MTRGRFITLEGGEGVGKSTQTALLADALRGRGIEVVVTREPGGTAGAEAIRQLLLTGSEDRWSAHAEALLFAAARADHVEKVIGPGLKRGAWIICDRFIDSSRAYQGGAGGLRDEDILDLHRIGSGGLMPDRTFLLTLSDVEAADRLQRRTGVDRDRFDDRDTAYHHRLADAFLAFATVEPKRFKTIDTSRPVADITASMMQELHDLL